jgi:adenylate kinase family enzyme
MKRILIIGSAGAGKTTLARYISQQCALPLIHLDQEFWRPGWASTPGELWKQRIAQIITQPAWIIDGYYHDILEETCRAADTIIFLDLSHRLCTYRVCLRYLKNRLLHQVRLDLPDGCPEQLRWSFLSWIWTFPQKQRPAILQTIQNMQKVGAEQHIIIIHNQAEFVAFVNSGLQ